MLPKEGRDLDMLLVGERSTMGVEATRGSLRSSRRARIPGMSGLYGTARGSIISGRLVGLVDHWRRLGAQSKTDI